VEYRKQSLDLMQ